MTQGAVDGAEVVPSTPAGGREGAAGESRRAGWRRQWPLLPMALLLLMIFFLPILLMIVYSFWTTDNDFKIVPEWTLKNYSRFFTNETYLRTFGKTLVMAGLVTAAGILADAVCLRLHPAVTFARRLVRDLAEARKPPLTLVRRGLGLARAEPELVRRWTAAGCRPLSVAAAERSIRAQADRVGHGPATS